VGWKRASSSRTRTDVMSAQLHHRTDGAVDDALVRVLVRRNHHQRAHRHLGELVEVRLLRRERSQLAARQRRRALHWARHDVGGLERRAQHHAIPHGAVLAVRAEHHAGGVHLLRRRRRADVVRIKRQRGVHLLLRGLPLAQAVQEAQEVRVVA